MNNYYISDLQTCSLIHQTITEKLNPNSVVQLYKI